MKKLLDFLIVIQVLISGCNNNSNKTTSLGTPISSITTIQGKNLIKQDPHTIKSLNVDSLDISFIGKTTQELNKYNFHCWGLIIEEDSENEEYAVAEYSMAIENCRNGKSIITLEKFIDYFDKTKANFIVKDELKVNSSYPRKCYSTVVLELKNLPKCSYLIEYEDNSKEILTNVSKIWKVDLKKSKFIEIKTPENFRCYNPDYTEET